MNLNHKFKFYSENRPYTVLSCDDHLKSKDILILKEMGVHIIEIRVDTFKSFDKQYIMKQINKLKKAELPLLLTIRSVLEGGVKDFSDDYKMELFIDLAPHVDLIDIELSSSNIIHDISELARKNSTCLIISHHDFKKTPSQNEFEQIIFESKKFDPDLIKIAAMPQNRIDVEKMLEYTINHKNENLITICMGRIGKISRLFFPLAGSFFTYTFLGDIKAPGQIPLQKLNEYLGDFY